MAGRFGAASRPAIFGLVALALTGCGSDSWFGADEKAPLPGERLPVLLRDHALEPDPGLADSRVRLPRPLANVEWSQPGGTANHAMHHLEVAGPLKEIWRTDIGAGNSSSAHLLSGPVEADGRIYVMDTEGVIGAYDIGKGKKIWRTDTKPKGQDTSTLGGGVAFDDGRLFVTTAFGDVIAYDAATGKEIWRHAILSPMRTAPTVRGGRVFALGVDNQMRVLAADDGRVLWTHSGLQEVASVLGGGSPAVDAGVVVVTYSSGEIYALRVENGHVIWQDSLSAVRRTDAVSAIATIRGRPIIDRGMVFAVSHGGLMVAIDLRSGARVWEQELASLESPWLAGDYIYVLTADAQVVCLLRKTGQVLWIRPLQRYENEQKKKAPLVWSGPVLASDRLIVTGSLGEALSLSPYTGKLLGRLELPDGVTLPPIAADGTLYLLTDDADLIALR